MDEKMVDEGQSEQNSGVSRRKLLKLLAAAGLAVSVERLLPGGWLRPAASVSAGGFPGYPGACTAADFPLVITNSRAALVNALESKYRVQFVYNETGGYVDNNVCIFATVVKGETIYNGQTIFEANGGVYQMSNSSTALPCLNPFSTDGTSAPATAPIYVGNGTYYFYYALNSSEAFAAGRDAAQELSIEWFLLQPDDRSSNTVQTITTPLAVSLSDMTAESGDMARTAVAAGVASAAALGAATYKALSQKGDEEAAEEA